MKIDSRDQPVLTVRDSLTMSAMNRRPAGADFSMILPQRAACRGGTLALAGAEALA